MIYQNFVDSDRIHWASAGREASKQGEESFKQYLRDVELEKRQEAKILKRSELESAYVQLNLMWAALLGQVETTLYSEVLARMELGKHHNKLVDITQKRRKGAERRHAIHQEIKAKAHGVWLEWQAGKRPEIGTSQAAFGRYVSENMEVNGTKVEARTAEGWTRSWRVPFKGIRG